MRNWILIAAALMIAGCRSTGTITVPPPVETHTDQTVSSSQNEQQHNVTHEYHVKDSVVYIYTDSIITKEFWHYERDYRYEEYLQNVIDSLLKVKQDSIPYPVPYPVEVPAKLTRWQNAQMALGDVFLIFIMLYALIWLVKKRRIL